jgi:lysophospholipase L1-like esterase
MLRRLPPKTTLAAALFAALLFAMRLAPGLDWVRAPTRETASAILRDRAAPPPSEPGPTVVEPIVPPTPGPDTPAPRPTRPDVVSTPGVPRVSDPSRSLVPFFAALRRAESGQGPPIRILHYGDSPTTADSITADVRDLLHRRYGDGGHGFLLIAKPWAWYGHRGVNLRAEGWTMEGASLPTRARDRWHGLGGLSFTAYPGAYAVAKLPDNTHRKVDVHYLAQPGGGEFQLEADGAPLAIVQTAADEKAPAFAQTDLPDGAQSVKLVVKRGMVRLFGWTFERGGSGVVYSSIGQNGATAQTLVAFFDEAQWARQLQHQKPDLVVFNYGSNESVNAAYVDKYYEGELRKLIKRAQTALPQTSILIMSPMDRGQKDSKGDIVTVPTVPRIVEIQQRVSLDTGCAFFNTYAAMGGAGTMAQWYAAKPKLVNADYLHPTPGGAAKVGSMLDEALREAYDRWKAAQ